MKTTAITLALALAATTAAHAQTTPATTTAEEKPATEETAPTPTPAATTAPPPATTVEKPATTAEADPLRFSVDTDPSMFALGGYSAWGTLRLPVGNGLRVRAGAFSLAVPTPVSSLLDGGDE